MKTRDMLQAARLLRLAVAMALALLLQAISPQGLALAYSATDEWLVYWYLCGSDLESENGAATDDIKEVLKANLPANVNVLIQTGGSNSWQNTAVPDGQIGRFLYSQGELYELEILPDRDMGDGSTLKSFLEYGKDNYAADHRIFVFWDHGGGSANGLCEDERTGSTLSLNDIQEAFAAVHTPDPNNPPFEMVGIDACLMASYDMANALYGISRYMTASEELESGLGWQYDKWLSALGSNPAMDGAALGKIICDTYMESCRKAGTDDTATLSCIDLSYMPTLRNAYEAYGIEALRQADANPQEFFRNFDRAARETEHYGGNTSTQGYANMIDLGDLAYETNNLMWGEAQTLDHALKLAVTYNVHGAYRKWSTGLSCFYPYSNQASDLRNYMSQKAAPLPQKCLYSYFMYGQMPQEGRQLLAGEKPAVLFPASVIDEKPGFGIFNVSALEDTPVHVDNDGSAFVELTQKQMDQLSSVRCHLAYVSEEDDVIIDLGSDANIIADWDTGIMKDNFDGTWPMLNGHPVYVDITAEKDGYNMYSIPIILNGVRCNLQAIYHFDTERYYILGARKAIDENGMGDRNLIKIKPEDTITTIHNASMLSDPDGTIYSVDVETFKAGKHLIMSDEETGDGFYAYFFEFVSPNNETALSNLVEFTIKNGEITTTAHN